MVRTIGLDKALRCLIIEQGSGGIDLIDTPRERRSHLLRGEGDHIGGLLVPGELTQLTDRGDRDTTDDQVDIRKVADRHLGGRHLYIVTAIDIEINISPLPLRLKHAHQESLVVVSKAPLPVEPEGESQHHIQGTGAGGGTSGYDAPSSEVIGDAAIGEEDRLPCSQPTLQHLRIVPVEVLLAPGSTLDERVDGGTTGDCLQSDTIEAVRSSRLHTLGIGRRGDPRGVAG